MTKKVYLAGAIFETPDPHSWRNIITKALSKDWQAINPLHFEISSLTPEEMVDLDLKFIMSCNAVVAYTLHPSWGTAMEIMFAKQKSIPVIAWVADVRAPQPPWLLAHVYDFADDVTDIVNQLEIL